jgi:HD-GYP domain-containing protein (c-di-GMP phosphodiesterase class II)
MTTKVFTTDLKVGMFVADLDRPWVDTPFLLQGFLIEDEEQIAALRTHCEYVIIDRARSTGDQYQAPTAADISRKGTASGPGAPPPPRIPTAGAASTPPPPRDTRPPRPREAGEQPPEARIDKEGKPHKLVKLEDVARRGRRGRGDDEEAGSLGRMFSGLKGMFRRGGDGKPEVAPPPEPPPQESPHELEARASLLPPGTPVQTYYNATSIEEEAPRAREVVANAGELLDKLVSDIRIGQSFQVDRVEEIVDDMVESIVRNPQALMWVARLREQDITTYGHGLQVSVYITSFGRHLGFPKPQLSLLAQVGLLLDIGKIRLPRELLEKQGRLTDEEFEQAKAHVALGLEILGESEFDPHVIEGIAQHHERMNGSGYPEGLVSEEIGIFGRMAGIVDCFVALTNHRPYAAAVSSYEALRSITSWGGDFFHEPLVQQFVSSVGVFPVGSLIELSTGEVAVVVEHSKVRRLKPRVLVVTNPDKTPAPYPTMLDLLYDPKVGEEAVFIKRGLASGAYGLDLRDFYLA